MKKYTINSKSTLKGGRDLKMINRPELVNDSRIENNTTSTLLNQKDIFRKKDSLKIIPVRNDTMSKNDVYTINVVKEEENEEEDLKKYITFKNIEEYVEIDENNLIPVIKIDAVLKFTLNISERKKKFLNLVNITLNKVIDYMKNNYDTIQINNDLIKTNITEQTISTFDIGFEYFLSEPRSGNEYQLYIDCENLKFKKTINRSTIYYKNFEEKSVDPSQLEKINNDFISDLEKIGNSYSKFIMSYLILKSQQQI